MSEFHVSQIRGFKVWQFLEPDELYMYSDRLTKITYIFTGIKAKDFKPLITKGPVRRYVQPNGSVKWVCEGDFVVPPEYKLVIYNQKERAAAWMKEQERKERRRQRVFKLKDLRLQQQLELGELHRALERMDAQSKIEERQREMRYLSHAERRKLTAKTLAAAMKAMGFSLESMGDALNVPGYRFWEDESSRERDYDSGRKTGVEAMDES